MKKENHSTLEDLHLLISIPVKIVTKKEKENWHWLKTKLKVEVLATQSLIDVFLHTLQFVISYNILKITKSRKKKH